MLSVLARLTFLIAVTASFTYFFFNPQLIRIDTNLNDLNPEKIEDATLQSALAELNEDISHRFLVVIKGDSESGVTNARLALLDRLKEYQALSSVSDDVVREAYLSSLTPYRFNVLTESQRHNLESKSASQLARDAQRRLYQLGEGVRVVPFNADPLGWFSDYVLAGVSGLDPIGQSQENEMQKVSSFSVMFTHFPENMADQAALYQAFESDKLAVQQRFDVDVLYSGMFFFAVDSAGVAKSDIQLIAIGSAVGVIVLMMLVFRSLLPLLLSLSSIAVGIGFGVLASIYAFGSIHILTIVFGASLIGIVVDYSLHYFYHFLSEERSDQQATGEHQTLFRAMFLSVVTSLVGYGALSLSSLLILKKIALFSCAGLLMAWLSVMILGPLVTRRSIEARQAALRSIIKTCRQIFARNPAALKAFGLFLACASVLYLYITDVNTNDDPRRFFHVSSTLLAQEREVASLTQVYEPGRYLLVQGDSQQSVYNTIEALYREVDDRQSLFSILDWLPAKAKQQENYQLQAKLYQEGGALDIFSATLGLPASQFTALKTEYAKAQGSVLSFPSLMTDLPSLPLLWLERGGQMYSFVLIRKGGDLAAIKAVAETVSGVRYINTLANAMDALEAQRESGAQLLLLAYALIAVLLALYYRQLRAVFLLLIPLTASAVTVALVSLLGQPITVFHIMALFLVLGLGMDYIVFAKEMANRISTTQQAILLSAVTSLLSFGLLAFSSMPIVQAFGSVILIGNTINFIAAISLFSGRQS